MTALKRWWQADKGMVHGQVLDHVRKIETDQFDLFQRFVQLAALYDPNSALTSDGKVPEVVGVITENVIASNVDTVTAVVAASEVRARFMTDDGTWSQQRTARHLEWYAEGICKLLDVDPKCAVAFGQGAAVRGTGLIFVEIVDRDSDNPRVCVEHVLADDVVVDDRESRTGSPKQMHRRRIMDRDELKARHPKHAEAIDNRAGNASGMTFWAGYRPVEENEVVMVQSWRLPLGVKGTTGYQKGRYTETCDGLDLLDEEYSADHFPCAKIVWSPRVGSWYGIGLAERIKGHQQVINNGNYQIDRLVNLNAIPTTYVRIVDAKMQTQVQRPGAITTYKGDLPVTPTPPAISPEVYKRQADVKQSASQESGVNQMVQHGAKPAGIDSGVAMREYRDATTQRFAMQEKAYERLKLDVVLLVLEACKELGAKAPTINKQSRFGVRKLKWSDVDMGDVKVQISAAATLSRTPAGRTQLVLELAQGGIISQDSAKRLMQHPDVESELSLYSAALENIEECIEEIAEGEVIMPEPFMNLALAVWRGQQTYLKWRRAPEEILEALRQFVVQAAHMSAPEALANDNGGAAPMAANENADPMMAPMPTGPAPVAALAPEAMNLRAV